MIFTFGGDAARLLAQVRKGAARAIDGGVTRAVGEWAETDWLGRVTYGIFGRQATGPFKTLMDAHEAVHVWLTPVKRIGDNMLGRYLSGASQLHYMISPTRKYLEEAIAQTVAIWRTLGSRYRGADLVVQSFRTSDGGRTAMSLARAFHMDPSGSALMQGLRFPFRGDYGLGWKAFAFEFGLYSLGAGGVYWWARR